VHRLRCLGSSSLRLVHSLACSTLLRYPYHFSHAQGLVFALCLVFSAFSHWPTCHNIPVCNIFPRPPKKLLKVFFPLLLPTCRPWRKALEKTGPVLRQSYLTSPRLRWCQSYSRLIMDVYFAKKTYSEQRKIWFKNCKILWDSVSLLAYHILKRYFITL